MSITAWTDPVADVGDAEPWRRRLVRGLDQRAQHVREVLYDPAVHRPTGPHRHTGKDSAAVAATSVPNLIARGIGNRGWTLTGSVTQGANGLRFAATSAAATRRILLGDAGGLPGPEGKANAASKQVFGAGCPLLLALVVRPTGTFTDLTLTFGLADGTSFATGTRGVIDETGLPGSGEWKRYFVRLASFSASGHTTDCRVRLATSSTFAGGSSLDASLILLRPGHRLTYWQPGYLEPGHEGWAGTQIAAPLYDQVRDFDEAAELTPS